MCGIIGCVSAGGVAPILLNGLRKLEYRGYDSYGFATLDKGAIFVEKDVGKISSADFRSLPGSIGIGHTRWATHGGVTKTNAHPHMDCTKSIAVVHNGIIENYQELKAKMSSHVFASETDTEIIPHMIEEHMGLGLEEAVKKALSRLKGRYAVVILSRHDNKIIAARKGSPLIIGVRGRIIL